MRRTLIFQVLGNHLSPAKETNQSSVKSHHRCHLVGGTGLFASHGTDAFVCLRCRHDPAISSGLEKKPHTIKKCYFP